MRIAIVLGDEAEAERHQNKNDDALFFVAQVCRNSWLV